VKVKFLFACISIVVIFTGCGSEWSDTEKMILDRQAHRAIQFSNGGKSKIDFMQCFKNNIQENYSGKEYMNGGSTIGLNAIAECNRLK